ncbi:hypothetical protein IG193_00700 [Infirmifilum lucidum]|uniref:Uncharacterized protein n=1 Tax=Infirmifilum lucidum TaxID=2776706 RepID=A0A7L9FGT3_9CREN|nr:hypothetical protein [Infirmifilum lucidum]QOJ79020.1 hypothetical protein IG193_00700 [Infirmifilum lucidum]
MDVHRGSSGVEVKEEFEKEEGISRRRKLALLLVGLLLSGIVGGMLWFYFSQRGNQTTDQTTTQNQGTNQTVTVPPSATTPAEDAKTLQLLKIGFSKEEANQFNSLFSNYAQQEYNQTHLDFAKHYQKNKDLSIAVFNITENFRDSNSVLNKTIDKPNALEFVQKYPPLIKNLNFENSLSLYSRNSTVFNELYRNVLNDPRVTMDRGKLTELASKLFLDLGYGDKVKVLDPSSGNYKEEHLKKSTIQALGNYSVAIYQSGLPKHDRNSLFLLGNATQINTDIVDFSPIVFKSVDGKHFYLTPNASRETWLTAEMLKRINTTGFNILKHPEMFLGLNGKIITNAYNLFDEPYGGSYLEKN